MYVVKTFFCSKTSFFQWSEIQLVGDPHLRSFNTHVYPKRVVFNFY
jgi:hypothetical protein